MNHATQRAALRPQPLADTNPFSTRFVRPGAIDYIFPPGTTAQALTEKLAGYGWWGQIVGPHGSGKSSLVHTLLPFLERADRNPVLLTMHRGEQQLDVRECSRSWCAKTQVVADGYEQLDRRSRRDLTRQCRHCGCGLLVTTHAPVSLPVLFRTQVSLELVRAVVARLWPAGIGVLSDGDIRGLLGQSGGNVREFLFALYDRYEIARNP